MYDIAVIGGGPAGLSAAVNARARNKSVLVVTNDYRESPLYKAEWVDNYLGMPGRTGPELLEAYHSHAEAMGTVFRAGRALNIMPMEGTNYIGIGSDMEEARAVILATGVSRGRKYPGEAEFLGRGVSYCATCDGAFYRNREVVVVGLNPEAVEEAQVLTKFASTVHWITPKDPHTLDGHADELLAHPSVKLWEKTRLIRIKGEEAGVTAVEVRHPGESDSQELLAEGVFVYLQGSKPITDFVAGQVEMKPDGGVWVDEMMQTSVPGVWGIGDIRNTPFKQAVVAAGDGCIAAMAIDRFLNSRKAIKPDWAH